MVEDNFTTDISNFDFEDDNSIPMSSMDIIITITALTSAIANIVIILIIVKFQNMRTRSNIYLANWCFCNLIALIEVPILIHIFLDINSDNFESTCLVQDSMYGMFFGNLIFVFLLLLDWHSITYRKQSRSVECQKIPWLVIRIAWIVIVGSIISSVSLCLLNTSYPLTTMCYIMGYFVVLITLVVVFILSCTKTDNTNGSKSNLALVMVASIILCWMPNRFYTYVALIFKINYSELLEQLTLFLCYSQSSAMLIGLYFLDKSFRIHLRKVFCKYDNRDLYDNQITQQQKSGLL